DQGKSEAEALQHGDPGVGSPKLGEIDSTQNYGVAVPRSYLEQNLGSDPAAWRTARAQINFGGNTLSVPIIDLGPGQENLKKGAITDLSYPLAQGLGATGWDPVNMTLHPNAGPDYTTNRKAWDQEQTQIASSLGVSEEHMRCDMQRMNNDADRPFSSRP